MGVLALGREQETNVQTDAPRHGEHVPGNQETITQLINTNNCNLWQVMQQQAMLMSGGGVRLPAFNTAVVSFVLLTPATWDNICNLFHFDLNIFPCKPSRRTVF